MAMFLIAMLNIVGCLIISFYFGWKLTIVAAVAAMPPMFFAGLFRLRFEVQFEKLNAAVFADSAQFATEAVGAFRTVSSLTLEDVITERYDDLLQDHVKKAFTKARFTTLIFSASESVDMLCMALTFW
jgi:ATP-binding cassette, subfamily B (MDR/TAP), member 1